MTLKLRFTPRSDLTPMQASYLSDLRGNVTYSYTHATYSVKKIFDRLIELGLAEKYVSPENGNILMMRAK